MMRSLLGVALAVFATAAPAHSALVSEVHYVMGTYFRITADASYGARAARNARMFPTDASPRGAFLAL